MGWLLLALSIWGLGFTVNARWPSRNRWLLAPSFFSAWLTIELAPFHLVVQVAVTALIVLGGALSSWPGRVGLGLCLVSWVGLVTMVVQSWHTAATMRAQLQELAEHAPGDGGAMPRMPRSKLLMPVSYRRKGVRRVRNVPYARVGGRTLRLDVTSPVGAHPGDRRPALLQIHGGAWVIGDKREQGLPLIGQMAANGWVCFNANYRLSPFATWPDHLVDCKRAVAWVREHAEEYGADPDFICVTGGSAGGHLTALVALTANDPSYQEGFEDADTAVQAAVPFYGVYDFTNRNGTMHPRFLEVFLEPWIMKRHFADDPELFHRASPIDVVSPEAPPFLAIHGDRDTLAPVADARMFVERLRAVSCEPVLYAELAGAEHAFEILNSLRAKAAVEGTERFLTWAHRRHVAGVRAESGQAGRSDDMAHPHRQLAGSTGSHQN